MLAARLSAARKAMGPIPPAIPEQLLPGLSKPIQKMLVKELKEELKQRGLIRQGNKTQLVARLKLDIERQKGNKTKSMMVIIS